ncbi:MAG: hypothetical protein ACR2GC_05070 [Methyloceanibacter sp.]|uniref:hypothetical protein n=1 Tax=Methyloceanibacter sp. TaxID=1965321 RepID=UPI003D9ABEFB
MAKSPRAKKPRAAPKRARTKAGYRLPLPDPKLPAGSYRPFASDPGWNEAWWWLGIPVAIAIFVFVSYRLSPDWYNLWVTREGIGVLELVQFIMMVIGLAIAVQLLLPLVLLMTILAAMTCLYIGGEEVSWGQHIFYLEEIGHVTDVNKSGEFGIHNAYESFEKVSRAILQFAVIAGGLLVPIWCALAPRWRASRFALFLPSAIMVPAALGVVLFKLVELLAKTKTVQLAGRPSEAVEFYLYFFILAYLIVFERRISEMETDEAGSRN